METHPRLHCTLNTEGGRKKEQEEQQRDRKTDRPKKMDGYRQIFSSNNDFGEIDKIIAHAAADS